MVVTPQITFHRIPDYRKTSPKRVLSYGGGAGSRWLPQDVGSTAVAVFCVRWRSVQIIGIRGLNCSGVRIFGSDFIMRDAQSP